jgi:phosphocarrier protein
MESWTCWTRPTRENERFTRRQIHAAGSIHRAACRHTAMPMLSKDVVITNKLGLHARPAMQFVDVASQFASKVTVHKGGDEPEDADGKSVMQMLILAAGPGTPLRIDVEGEDAEAAAQALVELIEGKFGEE